MQFKMYIVAVISTCKSKKRKNKFQLNNLFELQLMIYIFTNFSLWRLKNLQLAVAREVRRLKKLPYPPLYKHHSQHFSVQRLQHALTHTHIPSPCYSYTVRDIISCINKIQRKIILRNMITIKFIQLLYRIKT